MGLIADFSGAPQAHARPIPQIAPVTPIRMLDNGVAPFNQGKQQEEVPQPVELPIIMKV